MKSTPIAALAAVTVLAGLTLTGCANEQADAEKTALAYAQSMDAHDGKSCDMEIPKSDNSVESCKKMEADLAATGPSNTNPEVDGSRKNGDAWGVSVKLTGGNPHMVVELVKDGSGAWKVQDWNYSESKDEQSGDVIGSVLGWTK